MPESLIAYRFPEISSDRFYTVSDYCPNSSGKRRVMQLVFLYYYAISSENSCYISDTLAEIHVSNKNCWFCNLIFLFSDILFKISLRIISKSDNILAILINAYETTSSSLQISRKWPLILYVSFKLLQFLWKTINNSMDIQAYKLQSRPDMQWAIIYVSISEDFFLTRPA